MAKLTKTEYRCNVCGYPCKVSVITSGVSQSPPEFTKECVLKNANRVPIWEEFNITIEAEDV